MLIKRNFLNYWSTARKIFTFWSLNFSTRNVCQSLELQNSLKIRKLICRWKFKNFDVSSFEFTILIFRIFINNILENISVKFEHFLWQKYPITWKLWLLISEIKPSIFFRIKSSQTCSSPFIVKLTIWKIPQEFNYNFT